MTAVLTFTLLLTYVIFTAVNERQTSSQPNQTESAECKDSTLLRDLEDAKCALELSCSVVCASLTASDDIAALVNQITSNVINYKLSHLQMAPIRIISDELHSNSRPNHQGVEIRKQTDTARLAAAPNASCYLARHIFDRFDGNRC